MDNVRRVYQTTVQTVAGIARPVLDAVKHNVTQVAQNNVPVLAKTSYGVCTLMISCNNNLIHFLMLGAPCQVEQFRCHRRQEEFCIFLCSQSVIVTKRRI